MEKPTDYMFPIVELPQGVDMRPNGEHNFSSVLGIGNIQHFLYNIVGKLIFHHVQEWWIGTEHQIIPEVII